MVAGPLIGVLFALSATTPAPDELRREAESSFHAGLDKMAAAPGEARRDFAKSARLYDQLRQGGANNAALARNLGNAALLADDVPLAILAYREGLRLAPDDARLWAGLYYARRQVAASVVPGFGRPPENHRPPWLPRWPWLWLTLGWSLSAVAWLLLALGWARQRPDWRATGWLLLVLALPPFVGLMLEAWADGEEARAPVVVVAGDGTVLRRGNGSSYPPACESVLQRGIEARKLFQRGDWLQIELASGEIGWVPRQAVLLGRP